MLAGYSESSVENALRLQNATITIILGVSLRKVQASRRHVRRARLLRLDSATPRSSGVLRSFLVSGRKRALVHPEDARVAGPRQAVAITPEARLQATSGCAGPSASLRPFTTFSYNQSQ